MTQHSKLSKAAQPVTIQPFVNPKGDTAVRVNVDYTRVPPPEAYYVADYARISATGATVEIIFGKLEGSLPRLRNKLEVKIPAYAFLGQWVGSLELVDQIKAVMEKNGFPEYSTPEGIDELTEKVQTVHANNVLISGGESECSIDLYLLPPRDLRFYLEKRETPHLEPLVRILTEGRLFVGLGQSFKRIAEQMKPFAPSQADFENAKEVEATV